jgi:hypothetical protein
MTLHLILAGLFMRIVVLTSYPPVGVTSPMGLGGGMGIEREPGRQRLYPFPPLF